jgi:hypothetical protein
LLTPGASSIPIQFYMSFVTVTGAFSNTSEIRPSELAHTLAIHAKAVLEGPVRNSKSVLRLLSSSLAISL